MSVKCLDNGNLVVVAESDANISGQTTCSIRRVIADELEKFYFEKFQLEKILPMVEHDELIWPPDRLEKWDSEGAAFVSDSPDGRTAVILQTKRGLWCGKWREKDRADTWITKMGCKYSPAEIIGMFRTRFLAKEKF